MPRVVPKCSRIACISASAWQGWYISLRRVDYQYARPAGEVVHFLLQERAGDNPVYPAVGLRAMSFGGSHAAVRPSLRSESAQLLDGQLESHAGTEGQFFEEQRYGFTASADRYRAGERLTPDSRSRIANSSLEIEVLAKIPHKVIFGRAGAAVMNFYAL